MIKQVWVAIHPEKEGVMVIRDKEPHEYDHWFEPEDYSGTCVSAEYKPAMSVMED